MKDIINKLKELVIKKEELAGKIQSVKDEKQKIIDVVVKKVYTATDKQGKKLYINDELRKGAVREELASIKKYIDLKNKLVKYLIQQESLNWQMNIAVLEAEYEIATEKRRV